MTDHYARYREKLRAGIFRIALTEPARVALQCYGAGIESTIKDYRVLNSREGLVEAGLLDVVPTPVTTTRVYVVTDIGKVMCETLRLAGYGHDLLDPRSFDDLPPPEPAPEDPFARFYWWTRAHGCRIILSRAAITVLRHFKETPQAHLGGRLRRKACCLLHDYGFLSREQMPDVFGRDIYHITSVGELFYKMLCLSRHIIPRTDVEIPRSTVDQLRTAASVRKAVKKQAAKKSAKKKAAKKAAKKSAKKPPRRRS